jgi:hypothetical protein
MARPLVTHLSAVGRVAVGALVACASAAPVPPVTAPVTGSAKTEASPARPAAPLPTTLLPGVGMSASKPKPEVEDDEANGPVPPCAKDEDCWSKTCCPARAPEECVHALRARRCAIVDVSCAKTPMHYTCVCDAGACKGRLAPP